MSGGGTAAGGTALLLPAVLTATAILLVTVGAAGAGRRPAPALGHADHPPAGHTGGFGEGDCTVCHLDAGPDLPGGSLEVAGVPATYRPGEEYALEVILRVEGTVRGGFQLSARHPDGSQAGDLRPSDARVQVLAPDSLPVTYAAQTAKGSEPASDEEARWTVVWTAPAAGPVRFHAAANSANGDESPLGDLVYTARSRSAPGS